MAQRRSKEVIREVGVGEMEAVFLWLSNHLSIKRHFRATDEWGAVCGRRPDLILVSLPLGFQMQKYSIQ